MTTATENTPATETVAVTKLSPGRARGVTKKTAPQTVAKVTRGQKAAGMTNAPKRGKKQDDTKAPTKRNAKAPATKRTAKDKAPAKAKASGNTLTTVDIAEQHDMNAKTLRARIRRNIDKWEPLFKDGERHVFADNATTRKAIAALLDA